MRDMARRNVVGNLGGELDAGRIATGTDPGWFGPESVAWKIHKDACLLVGGISALLTQTLHPLAMAGVAEHSSYENDPWGRLHRTSMFLAEVVYGDSSTAESSVRRVAAIHERVRGTAPDGREYRAGDPELLRYVHATEVLGFLRSYQRYGGSGLTREESDRYVAEMAVIATKLGADRVPTTVLELAECLAAYRPALSLGEQGASAVKFLKNPPGGFFVKLGYRAIFDGACALIDETESLMLGVSRERRRGSLLRSGEVSAGVLRGVLGESPVVGAAMARVGMA